MSTASSLTIKKSVFWTLVMGILFHFTTPVYAAQFKLTWDANNPAPDGYRLYQRSEGEPYDYSTPVWSGCEMSCTLDDPADGIRYYYVVRAYCGDNKSDDSDEVSYQSKIETFTIIASASDHGMITPSGITEISHGGSQKYTILPENGYYISDLLVNGQSVGPSTQYTFISVTESYSIRAIFSLADQPPLAEAGDDQTVFEQSKVTLDGSLSTDPDGHELMIIPQSQMTVISVDSEELIGADGKAENVIDGQKDTIWHTEWFYTKPNPPHEIVIDLGSIYHIQGFRYLPRQDTSVNGTVAQYAFYVSEDGQTWGTPVAEGVFSSGQAEKEILFQGKIGQYVLFEALSELNGQAWTSVAELNFLGDEITLASINLIPQSQMTVISVDSEELSGADGTAENVIDGQKDTIWHTEWFHTSPNPPHEIAIDLGSIYNIQGFRYLPRQDASVNGTIAQYAFYVSEDGQTWGTPVAEGVFSSGQAEKEILFQGKIGRYVLFEALSELNGQAWTSVAELNFLGEEINLIPQSQMTVISVDSEELIGADGTAENAIDGQKDTIWHTEWFHTSPNPPHEIVIDLGSIYHIQGFRYLPRQDTSVNGTVEQYAFYVSEDGQTWGTPVAEGVFSSGQAEKEILFQGKIGRYVLFEALSELNGQAWTSVAELNFLGY